LVVRLKCIRHAEKLTWPHIQLIRCHTDIEVWGVKKLVKLWLKLSCRECWMSVGGHAKNWRSPLAHKHNCILLVLSIVVREFPNGWGHSCDYADHLSERVDEWVNERMSERISVWMNEWASKEVIKWISERMNERKW
jgi:hypothetical protein